MAMFDISCPAYLHSVTGQAESSRHENLEACLLLRSAISFLPSLVIEYAQEARSAYTSHHLSRLFLGFYVIAGSRSAASVGGFHMYKSMSTLHRQSSYTLSHHLRAI